MRPQLQRRIVRDHLPAPGCRPPIQSGRRGNDSLGVIGLIDETSVPKKGDKTPGVQRQYCGRLGKLENCIVTVQLACLYDDLKTVIDSDLFLPEDSWSDDRVRCRDAKRFVLQQYPIQVKALRSAPHVSKAVISIIDADDCTVEDMKRQHDDALEASKLARRADAERIAVLVPRRNIETWVHHLLGEAVNENAKYPRFRGEERRCAPAAQEFARRCPRQMREDDLPSLRDGCVELQRLLV